MSFEKLIANLNPQRRNPGRDREVHAFDQEATHRYTEGFDWGASTSQRSGAAGMKNFFESVEANKRPRARKDSVFDVFEREIRTLEIAADRIRSEADLYSLLGGYSYLAESAEDFEQWVSGHSLAEAQVFEGRRWQEFKDRLRSLGQRIKGAFGAAGRKLKGLFRRGPAEEPSKAAPAQLSVDPLVTKARQELAAGRQDWQKIVNAFGRRERAEITRGTPGIFVMLGRSVRDPSADGYLFIMWREEGDKYPSQISFDLYGNEARINAEPTTARAPRRSKASEAAHSLWRASQQSGAALTYSDVWAFLSALTEAVDETSPELRPVRRGKPEKFSDFQRELDGLSRKIHLEQPGPEAAGKFRRAYQRLRAAAVDAGFADAWDNLVRGSELASWRGFLEEA